ncbi:MAG: CpsD/CapB family tyrosine-protein kinase [Myxococcota bacterium]
MAKVYEALQRAEQERKRRAEGDSAAVASVDWEPGGAAAPVSVRARTPIWKRWITALRSRGGADSAADFNKRRFALLQPESNVAEQFRTLRGRIDALAAQRPLKTLAVTSPDAGDGKSTAALNLAIVTSMSVGRRTLLIDCDLRRPQVHKALGVEPRAGLAEVLLDQASLEDAIVKVDGLNLEVLAVRAQPPNPSELLASNRMVQLLDEVAGRYDRVILDTPATLGMPDAKTVSDLCDGLILVVRQHVTPREDITNALDILERRKLLGLILNDADASRSGYGYY